MAPSLVAGQLREARAALAFRTALGCALCCALIFVPILCELPEVQKFVPSSYLTLGIFVCFMAQGQELGDTTKLAMTFGFSAPALGLVGLAMAGICHAAGGMAWKSEIVLATLCATSLAFILWGQVAVERQKPHELFFAHPSIIVLAVLPPAAFLGEGDHGSPYALTRGLVGGFVLGGFWAFLLAHLPLGLGAASARCRIPLVASAKLFALADYTDVLSLKWDDAPASHARRRQARFAAVSATVELGRVRQSAAFERLGRARLDSGVIGDFASKMEACRMGLQLLHLARARLAASGSRHGQLAEVVTYSGRLGEARMALLVVAARALRAAASLSASTAGEPPPQEVPGEAKLLGSGHSDAAQCGQAALDCRAALADFQAVWEDFCCAHWQDRLKEVYGPSGREGCPSMDVTEAFLAGRLEHARASGRTGAADERDEEEDFVRTADLAQGHVRSFLASSRTSADFMAVCSVAEAAASVAEAAAEMVDELAAKSALCRLLPGGVGFQAWIGAPFAGWAAWKEAGVKSGRHSLRLSLAVGAAGAMALSAPQIFYEREPPGFWTIATVLLCLTPTQGPGILKGAQRILGTLLGAGLGLASLTMAPGNIASLWSHIFLVAYFLKFFEPELKYAAAVAFVTYLFVVDPGRKLYTDEGVYLGMLAFAGHRIVDVSIGVVLTMLVSIFCLPDRAVDQVRASEHEALSIVQDTVGAACLILRQAARAPAADDAGQAAQEGPAAATPKRAFVSQVTLGPRSPKGQETGGSAPSSAPASPSVSSPSEGDPLEELRERTWECMEKLAFGGDGLSGAGDTLSDVHWEARIGSDGGSTYLCGCVWMPCDVRPLLGLGRPSLLANGERCVGTAPFLSRALRQCHVLASLIEPGLEAGAERILGDEMVARALGRGGCGLAECLESALATLSARLQPSAPSGAKQAPDAELGEAPADHTLAEALRLIQCLMAGAGASRARLGGVVGQDEAGRCSGLGGIRAAAIIFMLHEVVSTLGLAQEALMSPAAQRSSATKTKGPPAQRIGLPEHGAAGAGRPADGFPSQPAEAAVELDDVASLAEGRRPGNGGEPLAL